LLSHGQCCCQFVAKQLKSNSPNTRLATMPQLPADGPGTDLRIVSRPGEHVENEIHLIAGELGREQSPVGFGPRRRRFLARYSLGHVIAERGIGHALGRITRLAGANWRAPRACRGLAGEHGKEEVAGRIVRGQATAEVARKIRFWPSSVP